MSTTATTPATSSTSSTSSPFEELDGRMQELRKSGQFLQAVDMYERVVAASPSLTSIPARTFEIAVECMRSCNRWMQIESLLGDLMSAHKYHALYESFELVLTGVTAFCKAQKPDRAQLLLMTASEQCWFNSEQLDRAWIPLFRQYRKQRDLSALRTAFRFVRTHRSDANQLVSPLLWTIVIEATGACGTVEELSSLVNELLDSNEASHTDTATWNAVVMAYIKHNRIDEATNVLDIVQESGVRLNERSWTQFIQHCAKTGNIDGAVSYINSMIATDLTPSLHTWLALLNVYRTANQGNAIVQYFRAMQSDTAAHDTADSIDIAVPTTSIEYDSDAKNAFVISLAYVNQVDEAKLEFEHLLETHCVRNFTVQELIHAAARNDDIETVHQLLNQYGLDPAIVDFNCWNTIVRMSAQHEQLQRVFGWLHNAKRSHPSKFKPQMRNALLLAHTYAAEFDYIEREYRSLRSHGGAVEEQVQRAIHNAYATADKLERWQEFSEQLQEKGFTAGEMNWNMLLKRSLIHDRVVEALHTYQRMKQYDATPDDATWSRLVRGLSKDSRRTQDMLSVFSEMRHHGARIGLATWTSVIGVLCRTGRLSHAIDMLETMSASGTKPDRFLYSIVLQAFARASDQLLSAEAVLESMLAEQLLPNEQDVRALTAMYVKQRRREKLSELYFQLANAGVQFSPLMITQILRGLGGLRSLAAFSKILRHLFGHHQPDLVVDNIMLGQLVHVCTRADDVNALDLVIDSCVKRMNTRIDKRNWETMTKALRGINAEDRIDAIVTAQREAGISGTNERGYGPSKRDVLSSDLATTIAALQHAYQKNNRERFNELAQEVNRSVASSNRLQTTMTEGYCVFQDEKALESGNELTIDEWSRIITAQLKKDQVTAARFAYSTMRKKSLQPTESAVNILSAKLAHTAGCEIEAFKIVCDIISFGYKMSLSAWRSLITHLAEAGKYEQVGLLLDEVASRSGSSAVFSATWAIIAGVQQQQQKDKLPQNGAHVQQQLQLISKAIARDWPLPHARFTRCAIVDGFELHLFEIASDVLVRLKALGITMHWKEWGKLVHALMAVLDTTDAPTEKTPAWCSACTIVAQELDFVGVPVDKVLQPDQVQFVRSTGATAT
jgi:pentatricopeptide repeat protein